jgi:hypothetical protein
MTEPQKVTATAKGVAAGLTSKKPQNKWSTDISNCPSDQMGLVEELKHFLNDVLVTKMEEPGSITDQDVWSALCLSYTKLESTR